MAPVYNRSGEFPAIWIKKCAVFDELSEPFRSARIGKGSHFSF